jgi:hypothetical protein
MAKEEFHLKKEKDLNTGHWWITPVILATWEAENRMIKVQGQPGQFCKTPSPKYPEQNGLEAWLKQ